MRPALLALAAAGTGTTASWVPPTDPSGPPPGSSATLPAAPDADSEALRFHAGDQVQTIGISADDPTWETTLKSAWSRSRTLRSVNNAADSSLDYRSVAILQPGIYTLSADWSPAPWASIIGATGNPADVQIISTIDDPEGGLIDGGAIALEGLTLSTPDTPAVTDSPYGGPKYPIHWHNSPAGGLHFHVAHCILSNTNASSHGAGFLGIDCEPSAQGQGGALQMYAVTGTTRPGAWCGINAHNNATNGVWTSRLKDCDFSGAAKAHFSTSQPANDRWHIQDTTVSAWEIVSFPDGTDVSSQVLDTTTPIVWDTV